MGIQTKLMNGNIGSTLVQCPCDICAPTFAKIKLAQTLEHVGRSGQVLCPCSDYEEQIPYTVNTPEENHEADNMGALANNADETTDSDTEDSESESDSEVDFADEVDECHDIIKDMSRHGTTAN